MFGRIKKFLQSSRRRAELLIEARQLMASMEAHWSECADLPLWEIQELLLKIGLGHIKAVKLGHEQGKKIAQQIKETRWAPVKEASRN